MDFQRLDVPSLMAPIYGKMRRYDEDLAKMLQSLVGNLSRMFDGGISISENLDGEIVTYTTNATPDIEDIVPHTLKRVPVGFITTDINAGGVVYRGSTAFSSTNIYLKCTTGGSAVKVLVF